MTNYTYSRVATVNFNTSPPSVARSATGSLYDINDTAFNTPLNATLVVGGTVVTTLSSDALGFLPDFKLVDRVSCVWKQTGSSFATVLTTTDAIPGPAGSPGAQGKSVASAAASAGNLVLALNDGTTLSPVPLPTGSAIDDSSMSYLLNNGAQTRAALFSIAPPAVLDGGNATSTYTGTFNFDGGSAA